MATLIQIRRDTLENWTSVNPVLESGEISFVTNQNKFKVGDGVATWTSLPYLQADAFIDSVQLGVDTTGDYVKQIEGTVDHIIVSASGGESASVVLSLPQSISTTSTPTFLGATLDGVQIGVSSSTTIDTVSGDLVLSSESGAIYFEGDTTIDGDLQVEGSFVISGSTELNNKNITLGSIETPTDITADGGGIILKGTTDKNFLWEDTTDSWTSSEHIDLESGKVIKSNGVEILSSTEYTGNSATSTKLATARAISLSGDLSGSASFDGSASISINATIQPNSVSLSTDTTGNYVSTISGTASQVTVSGEGTEGREVILSLPSEINVNTSGNASTATRLLNARVIELSGDISGSASFDGSASVSINAIVQPNSVSLGEDTTGNYVAGVSAGTGITVDGSGSEGSTVTVSNSGVLSLTGTGNEISVSASNGDPIVSLPVTVIFPGTVTLNADPTQALHAATKQYVDAVTEGLHIHASTATATTANIADFENPPASIDGVTLTDQMRVLVKNQTTTSQNGIYVYVASTTELVRSDDFNSSAEIQGGDFVFVTGGNTYESTGWVQTEAVTTLGTDPIIWDQFSGAGTYLAGVGLELDGTTFNNLGVLSLTGTLDEVEVSASSGNIVVGLPSTISSSTTGNSATSDKLSTARTVALTGDVTGSVSFDGSASVSISTSIAENSVTLGTDTSGNYVATATAGTGIDISGSGSETAALTITNTGVTSLVGTANEVEVSASAGAITVSLPATINADTTGNAATATNGVVTTGSYSDPSWITSLAKSKVGLSNVENTALSTWGGSSSIVTLGTIGTGVWQGSSISTTYTDAKVVSVNGSTGTITGLATLSSPTFTGTPLAPTAAVGTNTTQIATTEFVQSRFSGSTVNTKVESYSLVLADAGKTIEMNVGSANNLTIPLNSSQALPIGTTIDVIQYGAGQTTLVATGGVTVRSKDGNLKLTGQYSGATLYKRGTDEWVAVGDLTS